MLLRCGRVRRAVREDASRGVMRQEYYFMHTGDTYIHGLEPVDDASGENDEMEMRNSVRWRNRYRYRTTPTTGGEGG